MSEKKKRKFSLRKLIYNDKYLIIISIVAAVCVWVATSINLSPDRSRGLGDVYKRQHFGRTARN